MSRPPPLAPKAPSPPEAEAEPAAEEKPQPSGGLGRFFKSPRPQAADPPAPEPEPEPPATDADGSASFVRSLMPFMKKGAQPPEGEAVPQPVEDPEETRDSIGLMGAVTGRIQSARQTAADAAEDATHCASLTMAQRAQGFTLAFAGGLLCFLLAFFSWTSPKRFGVFYTAGNIAVLASTGFLVGPKRHLKAMKDPDRAVASLVYVGAMLMTLLSALYFKKSLLVILFVVIQNVAFAWYSLSFIPGARNATKKCFNAMLS